MRNYLEKWAARDEEPPYRDIIVIGDNEPVYFMGRWQWKSQQIYSIGPNDTDICVHPGQKQKVRIYITPSDD